MRSALLVLVCGCTVTDLDPAESEVALAATIPECSLNQWCTEVPPAASAATRLHAVWAVDAGTVFAVGDSGTILRRLNGLDWASLSSGVTVNLRSVWAWSATDAWAGGPTPAGSTTGTLLHFDGATWTPVPVPTTTVDSIWGSGPGDVWFVGQGVVLRWNGTRLSTSSSSGGTLLSVSGTGPSDVWATGESANLRHYTGTWTTMVVNKLGSSMGLVFARAPNDVWVTTLLTKETARYNGATWTLYKTGGLVFQGIAGEVANDIWGVGNSMVGRWTGSGWTFDEPFGDDAALWSISTIPGHAWVVGNNGLIAHRLL